MMDDEYACIDGYPEHDYPPGRTRGRMPPLRRGSGATVMNEIHPLVMATIENERARRELELERLRSAREACVTSSAGGQNRAMALGKKIRQLEEITGSWRLVLATVLGSMDEMTEAAEDGPLDGRVKAAERETEAPLRVVGSRSPRLGKLRCVPCTERHRATWRTPGAALVDVTSEDLPDGGQCIACHGDVLA